MRHGVVLAVALVASTVVAIAIAQTPPSRDCEARFDAVRWKRTADEVGHKHGLTTRQRMADGLIACRTLAGRSRSDVRRLLGRPTEGGGRSWSYELGDERSTFAVDSEFLEVEFSRTGRVRSVSLYNG